MKRIRLASRHDDESLRKLVAETAMEGSVRLRFLREPSFLQSETIGNRWSETIVLEEGGKILGLGTRAGREMLVDGSRAELGYLGMLRASSDARNSVFLARCYRFLRQLHEHSSYQVPYYLTAILKENEVARRILESGRAGLPEYLPIADYRTYVIGRMPNKWEKGGTRIRVSKDRSDLDDHFECSRSWSQNFSLASMYQADDLRWLDLLEWEILEVRSSSASARALLCDMSKVRQTVVDGYPFSLCMLPYMNGILGCIGYPRIPHKGEKLELLYPCALSLEGDEEESVLLLVHAIRQQERYKNKFLAFGFDARFLPGRILKNGSISITKSILYKVAWRDESLSNLSCPSKPVHIDVGTL